MFDQGELQGYIAEYLGISTEDSEAVLDAVAAQHGLLIERAQGFWSFSHLTFQEYFTAKWFCDRADWQCLVGYISEKHWRQIFLLVIEMRKNANDLLLCMKQKVDSIVSVNEKLEKLLVWISKKCSSVNVSYKLAALRAFYFALARSLNHQFTLDLSHQESLSSFFDDNLALALDQTLAHNYKLAHNYDFSPELSLDYDLAHGYLLSPYTPSDFYPELQRALKKLQEQFPLILIRR